MRACAADGAGTDRVALSGQRRAKRRCARARRYGQEMVLTIMANLNHAMMPMDRLLQMQR
jgi:hypothetical protein